MSETKIPHWLTKRATLTPDASALEFVGGESLTFANLYERSGEFARKLAYLGVTKGDRVAILSSNQLEMIIAIHALSYLNVVAVMLNTRLTKDELTYQLKAAQASYLITSTYFKAEKSLGFSST